MTPPGPGALPPPLADVDLASAPAMSAPPRARRRWPRWALVVLAVMGLVSVAIGAAWLIDRVDEPVIDDRGVLARLVTAPETDGAAPVEVANTLEDPSFLRAVVADI